jgi:hypothetical protein
MQLIYRAQMFRYVARPSVMLQQPHAVNWRYQVADQTDRFPLQAVRKLREIRAFNWRFQMVLGS